MLEIGQWMALYQVCFKRTAAVHEIGNNAVNRLGDVFFAPIDVMAFFEFAYTGRKLGRLVIRKRHAAAGCSSDDGFRCPQENEHVGSDEHGTDSPEEQSVSGERPAASHDNVRTEQALCWEEYQSGTGREPETHRRTIALLVGEPVILIQFH